jgi:holo-[acyl-carrier protein] synthase
MIVGIGLDTVAINRFVPWAQYPHKKLQRIFSAPEIAYCASIPAKMPERLAARFAAREAFFKAFSALAPTRATPFLTVCKAIELQANAHGAPLLNINWHMLEMPEAVYANLHVHISITHTATTATVVVIVEK